MKTVFKFGDILTYSEKWYKHIGEKKPEKPILFVVTGSVDDLVSVVRENERCAVNYHHSFLRKWN